MPSKMALRGPLTLWSASAADVPMMLASVAARGLRFFIVAALLYWFGPPIRTFIDKYFGMLSIVFVVLLIGGFVLIKYVL